jgi:hypothetical protein
MKNWDKILDDFARKCKGGAPDMTNPRHLALLRESLLKFGWKENATNEFIGNLRNGEEKYVGIDEYRVYLKPGEKAPEGVEVQTSTHKKKYYEKTPGSKNKKDDKKGDKKAEEETITQSKKQNKEVLDKISKEKDPKKKEALKAEYIANQLDNMLKVSSIEKGAGRYNMSREDVEVYRKYLDKIMADPENEPKQSIDKIKEERKRKYGEITDNDIDNFIEDLEGSSKSGSEKSDEYDPEVVAGIKAKVRGKGGPGSSYTTGPTGAERYRNVIRAYLETGGISPITGEGVPFSECQLDHIISLDNWDNPDKPGDGPHNWMFMEERFNQYKGKKTNEDIRADLEEDHYLTDAEIANGIESDVVSKALKDEDRKFWKKKFKDVKGSDNPREVGLTINRILGIKMGEDKEGNEIKIIKGPPPAMTKPQLDNFIYGWNLANPDNELSRYETQKIVHKTKKNPDGIPLEYARGEGKSNPVKPVEGDTSTYGLSVGDKKTVTQNTSTAYTKLSDKEKYEASLKAFKDNRASGGRGKNKEQFIEMIVKKKLASDSTEIDKVFADMILKHRTGQLDRTNAIKDKVKAAQDLPGSGERKRKIVSKSLSEWDKKNIEPGGKNDKKKPFIKDSTQRKKSPDWQEWKRLRDIHEYEQWTKLAPIPKLKK